MNLTRVWCMGFPLGPTPMLDGFLQPWPRNSAGKWDLSKWDEAYFARIKAFAKDASDRGIVVEYTMFSTYYDDARWKSGPFYPANNVQGHGPSSRYDCYRQVDANLLAAQKAAIRRIVRELNGFDNVFFEIQNEPFWNDPGVKDSQEVAFHNTMLAEIRAEQAGLPNRHMVAHNFPQQSAALSSGFDIINEHYPAAVPGTTIAGAEALLANQYSRGKILSLDETDTTTELKTRLEAWMFFVGGGGIFNGLDAQEVVYSRSNPSGDNPLGNSIRGSIENAATYMESLDLTNLRRSLSWVVGGVPSGATLQASATPGHQYVAYLHHGRIPSNSNFQINYDPIDNSNHNASLRISLPEGSWKAVWTKPSDLGVIKTQQFSHGGGNITLDPVTYQADVALRIDKVETATAPSAPTGVRIVTP